MKTYYITQPIYDIDVVCPAQGRIGYESWVEPRKITGVDEPVYGFAQYGKSLTREQIVKFSLGVPMDKGEFER